MAVTSPEAFFKVLRKSQLLTAEQLVHAQDNLLLTDNAEQFAQLLVEEGLLSEWQASQLLSGTTRFLIGNYVLLDMLGRGGMGSVFLARHTTMNRQVALKIISRRVGKDPASLERFLTEARATASLDHPNIVRAYDVDQDKERFFIVMEYVAGHDLEDLVEQEGPLGFEFIADCIRQAAEGLAHAHRRSMVHCDVKPSNLLVTETGNVKILDMGMARLLNESAGDSSADRDGRILGTVDYMAPEQATDDPTFDHRADIYSLGCTMYCLLAGHPPFNEGTLAERILRHQTQPPPDILQEHPDTPPELVRICLKMMAKDAGDRYQTAEQVAQALAEWHPAQPEPAAAAGGPRQPTSTGVAIDEDDFKMTNLAEAPLPKRKSLLADERRLIFWMAAVAILLFGLMAIAAIVLLTGRENREEIPPPGRLPRAKATTLKEGEPSKQATTSPAEPARRPPKNQATQPRKQAGTQTDQKPSQKQTTRKRPTQKHATRKSSPDSGLTTGSGIVFSESAEGPSLQGNLTKPTTPGVSAEAGRPAGPKVRSSNQKHKKPNPLRGLPSVTALPPPSEAGKPVVLATLPLSPKGRPTIRLLGGTSAIKGEAGFVLKPQPEESAWLVRLVDPDGGQTDVARFWFWGNDFMFTWLDTAESTPAAHIRNCLLEFRVDRWRRVVQLVKPQPETPLTVELAKGGAQRRLSMQDPPETTALCMVITGVDGFPGKKRFRKAVRIAEGQSKEITLFNKDGCKVVLRAEYAIRGLAGYLEVTARYQLPGRNQLSKFSPRTMTALYKHGAALESTETNLSFRLANPRGLNTAEQKSLKDKLKKVQGELKGLKQLVNTYQASKGAVRVQFQEWVAIGKQRVVLSNTRLAESKAPPKQPRSQTLAPAESSPVDAESDAVLKP